MILRLCEWRIVVAAVVVAASAWPAAAQNGTPVPQATGGNGYEYAGAGPNMASAVGIGFFRIPMSGSCGSPEGTCGGCGARGPHRLTREDLPQHYAYFPAMHGYYYFYPYHPMHIPSQQAFASQFGMDPRNPYANDFFKVVYAEYKAAQEGSPGAPERIPAPPAGIIPKKKARPN